MSARRAVVVTAVLWAFWHTPFQLSGIQHVDGISAARLAMIAPIGIVSAGLVIGWLWVRTESIWIVVLAHGALNSWGQYAFKFMEDSPRVGQTHRLLENDALVLMAGSLALLAVGSLLVSLGLPSAPLRSQKRPGGEAPPHP
jgi:membrane protease YdiL (CAAX protease family)